MDHIRRIMAPGSFLLQLEGATIFFSFCSGCIDTLSDSVGVVKPLVYYVCARRLLLGIFNLQSQCGIRA